MSRDPGDPTRPPRRPSAPPPPVPGARPTPPARPPERPAAPIDPYDLTEPEFEPPPRAAAPTEPAPSTFRSTTAGKKKARSPEIEPPAASGGPNWAERILLGSVSTGHLALFCRQFAQYTDAGIPLLKSLASLERQFSKTALGPVLSRIHAGVKQGDSLTEAIGREPQAFDKLFLGTMRVAEARGGVPEALRRLADHYEARRALIRQAQSAMIYPVIVLAMAGAVIALITMFVLPMLFSSLELKQDNLPTPTRILMGFSKFMQGNGWWAIPAFLVGLVVGIRFLYKTARGKSAIDELLLYVPVFGKLLKMLDTSRFARTLGVLLDAGVDVKSSLNLTADMMQLAPFRRAVAAMEEAVHDGSDLVEAVRDTNRFDADVLARVEAGEESGKLPESLDRLADDLDERITYTVKNLGTLIQPLIFIILGGIVLFILLAFFMFYGNMISQLSAPGSL